MSSIVQNLPNLAAKSAESTPRSRPEAVGPDRESFDQILARSRQPQNGPGHPDASPVARKVSRASDSDDKGHASDTPAIEEAEAESPDEAPNDADPAEPAARDSEQAPAEHRVPTADSNQQPWDAVQFSESAAPTVVAPATTTVVVEATGAQSKPPAAEEDANAADLSLQKTASGVTVSRSFGLQKGQLPTSPQASGESRDELTAVAAPEVESSGGQSIELLEAVEDSEPAEAAPSELARAAKIPSAATDSAPANHAAKPAIDIATLPDATSKAQSNAAPAPAPPPQPQRAEDPQLRFGQANYPQIVNAVRGQLLPTGGTMQIRLDPPELGALMITVNVRNGIIDASFQTANEQATQLLSHSMTQLKHALESQGVGVDRLQVAQAPRQERSENPSDRGGSQQQQSQSQMDWERHSDQQRREMIKRMWAKLGVGDPLDLVA